jgi:long-subunit acyl-CoA synthetase (AMP-forming)
MISEKAHNEDIGIVAGQHVNLLWEPLSHSERVNTYRRMLGGSRIGIFDRDIGQDLFEDIQVIRPTSLISVPRFWNVLYAEYQKMLSLYKSKNPKKDTKKCDQQVRFYLFGVFVEARFELCLE